MIGSLWKKKDTKDQRNAREFLRYRDIARHIAGKFSRKYPNQRYANLVEVAEYALALELFGRKQFNKNKKTKKSSWLYTVIFFHLTHVCTRGINPCPGYEGALKVDVRAWWPEIAFSSLSEEEATSLDPEEKPTHLQALLSELGDEARALVQVILQAPEELASVLTPRSMSHTRLLNNARETVRAYLIDEFDWTTPMVDRAWSEVQGALS